MSKIDSNYVFIKELNGYMLFWIFLFGSVAGFVLEGIWCVVVEGKWENHSATVWGPFCVIYGIGGAAIYSLTYLLQGKNIFLQFLIYMIAGSVIEYFGSLFQELCFGSVSWDYSEHFGNVGGRISLLMSLIWGVLGICFSAFLFLPLQNLFLKFNGQIGFVITWALMIFMAVNLVVSSLAVHRWQERMNQKPADNSIGLYLDKHYDDEKMAEIYQNMKFVG